MDVPRFPCPSCGLPLPGVPQTPANCPRCRVRLQGPLAAELGALDREFAALDRRMRLLLQHRAGLLAQLRPALAPAPAPAPPPTPLPVQTTLLALGALLVSVAGTIFTVLAWGRLGIGGRAGVLLAATSLAATTSATMPRRQLHATADATAVLTLVLTALDLHALRLLVAADTSWAAWWAVAAAGLTATALATGSRRRLPGLTATGVIVGQAVLPLALAAALTARRDLDLRAVAVLVAVTLLGTACTDLLATRLPVWEATAVAHRIARMLGYGQLAVAGLLAAGADLSAHDAVDALPGAALLGLVAAVAANQAFVRGSRLLAGGSAFAALLSLVGPVVTTLLAHHVGVSTVLLAPATLGVLLVASSRRLPPGLRLGPVAVGLAATGLSLAPALEPVVAALAAPVTLLAHPWSAAAPRTTRGVVATAGAGPVDLADVLLVGLLAAALALLPRTPHRTATPLAAGLTVAAGLLLPATADVPLELAVGAALGLLTLGAAVLATTDRTRVVLVMLPLGGTALAWSAVGAPPTLLSVAAVAGLAAVVAAHRSDPLGVVGAGIATGAALALVPLVALAMQAGVEPAGCALSAAGALVLLVADRPTGNGRRAAVLGTAAATTALGVLLADTDAGRLSVLLAGLGAAALAAAARPHRRTAAALGALLLLLAGEIRLVLAAADVPEAYLLPAALLALTVGEVVRRRRPDLDPTTLLGPGLGLALGPSLLQSLSDHSPLRPLLLTAGAAAVVVAGARLQLRAPLVAGASVLTAVALRQLAPLAGAAPRWVVIGLVGLVLLVLGARYERTRNDMDRLRRSFARLS